MKNILLKSMFVAMFITCIGGFTTFASNVDGTDTKTTKNITKQEKKEYKAQITLLKEEIKKTNEEIKALRSLNTQYRDEFKKVNTDYKANKTLSISEENYKKALELKKSIPEESKKEVVLDSETSIQTFVDNDNYNAALTKLSANLDNKKKKLETLKNVNAIWVEIHELIKS